jgi:hypothetical protein
MSYYDVCGIWGQVILKRNGMRRLRWIDSLARMEIFTASIRIIGV